HFAGGIGHRNHAALHRERRLAHDREQIAEVECARLHSNQDLSWPGGGGRLFVSHEPVETADRVDSIGVQGALLVGLCVSLTACCYLRRAAARIRSAISCGWETRERAPASSSTVVGSVRAA